MALMDSKESILAAIKGTVQFIRNVDQDVIYCEDKLLAMIKSTYQSACEDFHSGRSTPLNKLDIKYSHTF